MVSVVDLSEVLVGRSFCMDLPLGITLMFYVFREGTGWRKIFSLIIKLGAFGDIKIIWIFIAKISSVTNRRVFVADDRRV